MKEHRISFQTRGYENWQGGEANLLITRGLVGRLSNTPNVGTEHHQIIATGWDDDDDEAPSSPCRWGLSR